MIESIRDSANTIRNFFDDMDMDTTTEDSESSSVLETAEFNEE